MREFMETVLYGTLGYVLCLAMRNKAIGILILLIMFFSVVNIAKQELDPVIDKIATTIEQTNETIEKVNDKVEKVEKFTKGVNEKVEKADSFINRIIGKLKFWE